MIEYNLNTEESMNESQINTEESMNRSQILKIIEKLKDWIKCSGNMTKYLMENRIFDLSCSYLEKSKKYDACKQAEKVLKSFIDEMYKDFCNEINDDFHKKLSRILSKEFSEFYKNFPKDKEVSLDSQTENKLLNENNVLTDEFGKSKELDSRIEDGIDILPNYTDDAFNLLKDEDSDVKSEDDAHDEFEENMSMKSDNGFKNTNGSSGSGRSSCALCSSFETIMKYYSWIEVLNVFFEDRDIVELINTEEHVLSIGIDEFNKIIFALCKKWSKDSQDKLNALGIKLVVKKDHDNSVFLSLVNFNIRYAFIIDNNAIDISELLAFYILAGDICKLMKNIVLSDEFIDIMKDLDSNMLKTLKDYMEYLIENPLQRNFISYLHSFVGG